jgi:hypothetical protein
MCGKLGIVVSVPAVLIDYAIVKCPWKKLVILTIINDKTCTFNKYDYVFVFLYMLL